MPLKHLVKEKIDTHLLAFEIYFRKGGWGGVLLALRRCPPPRFTRSRASSRFREIRVDAPVNQRRLGHRPRPPVAAPVSSPLLQRRWEGLPVCGFTV